MKITFSKLNCEEISSIYLFCDQCAVFDIPDNAEIISFCSTLDSKHCPECYINDVEWPSNFGDVDIVERETPILDIRPDFPEYYMLRARLQTFDVWPKTMKQTSEELSIAGFFYTQKDDRVICFCCGGGLYQWDKEDVPWEQHALHYSECGFLQFMKGHEYIASIKEKFAVAEAEIPDLSELFREE